MPRPHHILAVLAWFLLLPAASGRPSAGRTDHHGDPLPPRALARLGTARLRHEGHDGPVGCLAFSPDGKTLLSAGGDARAALWDATSGKRLHWLRGVDDYKGMFLPLPGR